MEPYRFPHGRLTITLDATGVYFLIDDAPPLAPRPFLAILDKVHTVRPFKTNIKDLEVELSCGCKVINTAYYNAHHGAWWPNLSVKKGERCGESMNTRVIMQEDGNEFGLICHPDLDRVWEELFKATGAVEFQKPDGAKWVVK